MRLSAPPPEVAATTPNRRRCAVPSAIVAAENSLSQHRGDVRTEMCGVVKLFDVGAVDTEYVIAVDSREVLDDMVDHPVLPWHLLT